MTATEIINAKEPFRFYTRLHLTELIGLRASNLTQLVALIKEVPGACIYHHTHRFLQQHQYLSPEPPNDFAYWVSEILNEQELGEKLASIDTFQYSTIRSLREKIAATIEQYLKDNKLAKLRFAGEGAEFHFIKSVSFVLPTDYVVNNLKELLIVIKKITIDSIYFHMFESRLRLERMDNDFSNWIRNSIGNKELAGEISKLDPYTYTLDGLRNKLIVMLEKRITI